MCTQTRTHTLGATIIEMNQIEFVGDARTNKMKNNTSMVIETGETQKYAIKPDEKLVLL